eukprot:363259-Chlamydomonas_euryale.AAC.14
MCCPCVNTPCDTCPTWRRAHCVTCPVHAITPPPYKYPLQHIPHAAPCLCVACPAFTQHLCNKPRAKHSPCHTTPCNAPPCDAQSTHAPAPAACSAPAGTCTMPRHPMQCTPMRRTAMHARTCNSCLLRSCRQIPQAMPPHAMHPTRCTSHAIYCMPSPAPPVRSAAACTPPVAAATRSTVLVRR